MTEWRWVSASIVGTSHSISGMECQDSHLCEQIETSAGPVLLGLASDGAGSATRSALGSRLLCDVLFEKTIQYFEDEGKIEQLNDRIIGNWIESFRSEVILQADADGLSDREYACTLLGAIVGNGAAALFQVG